MIREVPEYRCSPNMKARKSVGIDITYIILAGIRGELNVTVKVDLFSDFNKFRQSSCGVQFLCSKSLFNFV